MADVSGKFYSATKVRTGVSPSSPGVEVGETLPPVNPPGGGLNSVGLTMPPAFAVANSPLTSNGTLEVTGAGTTAQYIRGDGSLASFPSLTGYVPYTGATADVDLGTHDLTAERGTFENNGSSDTLTVNHTSGSGYGIKVSKGGNNEALYVSKTSGSGNAMTVVGGRTSLVDLSLSSVSNATGNFLTISGGVVHQRTASETRSDVGAQAQLNGTGFVKASGTTITYDNSTYQVTSEKAQPNGYASLDSNGKVPLTQINDALIGNVNYQGLWNASTNTPTLANPPSSGTKGYYYIVSTAGTFAGISFEVGDWIISSGSAWQKIDNTDAVSSVFGRTGNVTAANGDYTTAQVTESGNLYYTDGRARGALSFAAGSGAYNSSTGVITIPTNNNQITNGAGYITSASTITGASGALTAKDNRTISPDEDNAGELKFGFTSWANNNSSPYADYLHLRSYTDSSGGNDNLVMFLKSGIGMRIYQQSFGSSTAYSSFKDIAFTDGTNASGTWGINITGNSTSVINTVTGTNSAELVRGNMGDNDQFRILVGASGSNAGYAEIATADDGTEPIYVRQYTGVFSTLIRTATLLDGSGNTSFPGTITGSSIIKNGGTSSQFLKADGSVDSNTYVTGGPFLPLTGGTLTNTGGNQNPILAFASSSTDIFQWITRALNANMGVGNTMVHFIGQSADTKNSGYLGFNYAGNQSDSNYLSLGFFNNDHLVRLYANGNLGVGVTSNAGFKLDVNGTGRFSASAGNVLNINSDRVGGGGIILSNLNSNRMFLGSANWQGIDGISTSNNAIAISNAQNADIIFAVNMNNVTNGERMRITSSGNVLIGTTDNAGFKLDVNGTGRFSGLLRVMTHYAEYSDAEFMGALGFNRNPATGAIFNNARAAFQLQNNLGTFQFRAFSSAGADLGTPLSIASTGAATFSNLSGSGNRIVVANSGGTLISAVIGSGLAFDGTTLTATGGSSGSISGSGTSGTIPVFTGTSSIGNSVINQSGTNVGIGMNSPADKLIVNGNLGITDGSFASGESYSLYLGDKNAFINSTFGQRVRLGAYNGFDFGFAQNGDLSLSSTWMSINGSGEATFSSSVTAGAFFESSDATIKTLVQDNYQAKGIESVVAKLYIKNGKKELGYFAQDLQGILPSAVNKGSDGLLNLSYREVHTAKIASLENRIKELESQLKNN